MRVFLTIISIALAGCQVGPPHSLAPLKPPLSVGEALPTPTIPLRETGNFAGPVPGIDRLDQLVTHFDTTIFQTEFQGPDPYVKKWSEPIYYSVETTHLIRIKIQETGDLLERVTGIAFHPTGVTDARRNMTYQTAAGSSRDDHCWAFFDRNSSGQLMAADILIGPTHPEDSLHECVEEETSQVLGAINDSTTIDDTLWRPWEQKIFHRLTWSDAVILRTLYDERLKPGMHRNDAMPIARQIIGELLEELNR